MGDGVLTDVAVQIGIQVVLGAHTVGWCLCLDETRIQLSEVLLEQPCLKGSRSHDQSLVGILHQVVLEYSEDHDLRLSELVCFVDEEGIETVKELSFIVDHLVDELMLSHVQDSGVGSDVEVRSAEVTNDSFRCPTRSKFGHDSVPHGLDSNSSGFGDECSSRVQFEQVLWNLGTFTTSS